MENYPYLTELLITLITVMAAILIGGALLMAFGAGKKEDK